MFMSNSLTGSKSMASFGSLLTAIVKPNDPNSAILEVIDKMPLCSEKIILKLINTISTSKSNSLESELENLIKRLKIEGLYLDNTIGIVNQLDNYIKNDDTNNTLKQLKNLLNNIRDLDIQEIIREKKSYDEMLNLVKNENIYILLGLIGSGKSTTVHYLAGSKIEKIETTNHLMPTKVTNRYVEKVKVSSTISSETKTLIPVVIKANLETSDKKSIGFNLKSMLDKFDNNDKNMQDVIICDSRGFQETAAEKPEIDILNTVALKRAIEICSGIKPVIVISKFMGDRFNLWPKLAQFLFTMFENPEDFIKSSSYVFTKYSKKEEDSLRPTLTSILNELKYKESNGSSQEIDAGLKLILEDILEKTSEKTIFVEPINGKSPQSLLRKICDGKFITNPETKLNISFNYNTKQLIEKQIEKHFNLLEKSLLAKEYDLAIYKLTELLDLQDIIQQKEIDEKIMEKVAKFNQVMSSHYKQLMSNFNQKIITNENLNEQDLKEYLNCLTDAKNSENVLKKLFGKNYNKYDELKETFLGHLDKIIEGLKAKNLDEQIEFIKLDLDNLKFINEYFKEQNEILNDDSFVESISKKYSDAFNFVNDKINEKVESSKDALNGSNFNEIANRFLIMENFNQTESVDLLKKNLLENFDKKIEEAKALISLEEENVSSKIQKLKEIEDYFASALKCKNFHKYVSLDDLKNRHDTFIGVISNYLETESSKINFESNSSADIETHFNLIYLFGNDYNFSKYFKDIYNKAYDEMTSFISKKETEINDLFDSILNGQTSKENSKNLLALLNSFKEYSWFDKYQRNISERLVSSLDKKMADYMNRLDETLNGIISSKIEDHKKVAEINLKFKIFPLFDDLFTIFPNLKSKIDEKKEWFLSYINRQCDFVNKSFQITQEKDYMLIDLDNVLIENVLTFLEVCDQLDNYYLQSNYTDAKLTLRKYLTSWLILIEEKLDENLNEIEDSIQANQINLTSKVDFVRKCIDELKFIKENCPKTIEILSNLINVYENLINRLVTIYTSLDDDINMLKENLKNHVYIEKLLKKIKICRILSKIDKYLDSQYSFGQLFRTNQNQENQIGDNALSNSLAHIENLNFDDLIFEMKRLSNLNSTEQYNVEINESFKKRLEKLVNDMNKQIKLIVDHFDEEKLNFIKDSLNNYEIGRLKTKEFFKDLDLSSLDMLEKEIEASIKSSFDNILAELMYSMKQFNIDQIKDKVKRLTELKPLLDLLSRDTLEIDHDDIEENDSSFKKLKTKINNIPKMIQDLLVDKIEKFKDYKIEEYSYQSPEEMFRKLDEISVKLDVNSDVIKDLKNTLSNFITEKFNIQLDELKKIQTQDLEKAQENIKFYERYLVYLPDELKVDLSSKFEELTKEINEKFLKDELDPRIKYDKSYYENLLNKYDSLRQSDPYSRTAQKIKDFVNEKTKLMVNDTREEIASNKIDDLFNNLNELTLIQEIFNTGNFSNIKEDYKKVNTEVNEYFVNLALNFKSFIEAKLNRKVKPSNKNKDFKYEEAFDNLNKYANYQANFKANLQDLDNQTLNLLKSLQKDFNESFNQEDESKMNISLWKFTFDALTFFDSYSGINNNLKDLCDSELPDFNVNTLQNKFETRIKLIHENFMNIEFPNKNEFQSAFDNFYKLLSKQLNTIRELNKYFESILPDLNQMEKECCSLVENKINEMNKKASNALDRVLANLDSDLDLEDFIVCYNNLKAFEKNSADLKIQLKDENFESNFLNKITEHIASGSIQNDSVNESAQAFIKIKKIATRFFMFKDRIDKILDSKLEYFISFNGGFDIIGKLAVILNKDKIGNLILSEHKSFSSYQRALFNSKTSKRKIDNVLEDLKSKNNDVDETTIKTLYNNFESKFESLITEYLQPDIDYDMFITNLKLSAANIKIDSSNSNGLVWSQNIKKQLPDLIANVFALWTLLNSQDFFKLNSSSQKKDYLFKPHSAQVLSIFRMLGLGYSSNFINDSIYQYKKDQLNNNLIQIGTGEGKSITLGVTSIVLALLGLDVYCVCYSNYLSERDYLAFKPLFDRLDLTKNIHYGTFNKICEQVINESGDLRKTIEDLVLSSDGSLSLNEKKVTKLDQFKVLLIDEVDVFFSKDFYGSSYQPSASLRDITITKLINYIWKHRNSGINFNKIIETDEYKKCSMKFGKWKGLLDEAIKEILNNLSLFSETHTYVVKDDKIGYKEQDEIVFDTSYGYQTLFAYYYENEKSNISDQSLNENTSILVKIGSFSYAEIPLMFNAILGVTATLDTLNKKEEEIIKDVYKIKLKTIMPSIYTRKNVYFKGEMNVDLFIENDKENYFRVLKSEINKRIVGTTAGTKRAVFVFFESKKELNAFFNSEEFLPFRSNTIILTEEANTQEKKNIITNSTNSGKITLFTKVFGRGTDFVTYDQIVSANGGIHVIQTFLSPEQSEEIQIRGRTGRQEEEGSFSMVLLGSDLEKFGILPENIQKESSRIYEFLNNKRNEFSEIQYNDTVQYVKNMKTKHEKSMSFLKYLKENDLESAQKYLFEENKGIVQLNANSKTLILLDATGSMSNLLEKAKKTLDIMFNRIFQILEESNVQNSKSFQIKIAVYRNYNSTEDLILETSTWENKPDNLLNFLKKIRAQNGWANEAIEIGLWQANQEVDLSQVILIGDAAANTREEVVKKRRMQDWRFTKFSVPTYYEDELEKLKSNNVKVHAFYLNERAKENFKEIADFTGGNSEFLDIDSSKGSDILIDLVTQQVLSNIGGSALVQAYKTKYNSF